MNTNKKQAVLSQVVLACLMVGGATSIFAAQKIAYHYQQPSAALFAASQVSEINRGVSKNQTLHVRIQQKFKGYPVWGSDAVLHIPNAAKYKQAELKALVGHKSTLNGAMYQAMERDLREAPAAVFTDAQAKKALQTMKDLYQQKVGQSIHVSDEKITPLVYIDNTNQAHFAYKISFFVEPIADGETPTLPTYLVEAKSLQVFEEWDDLHTATMDKATASGYGGNAKTGQYTYDGLPSHLPALNISRDATVNMCYMMNDVARVKARRTTLNTSGEVMSFSCPQPDATHNNTYWNGLFDQTAGAFSPANDALYTSQLVHDMFADWYDLPVVAIGGKPITLLMTLHYSMNNAFYSGGSLSMGDGMYGTYHPFTTRDIIAHEMSHAFTDQYSQLVFTDQSGGINESFGDLTAKAAEFYATGSNSWDFAADVMVNKGSALRYMDRPSKDCTGKDRRAACSIDNMQQYKPNMDKHQLAGIFNRVFFLWATSAGWDTRRVYDVVVEANMHYWTSKSTFSDAACGVLKATEEMGYSKVAPVQAFNTVGVDITAC